MEYLRPLLLKDKCENCSSTEKSLHLHHVTPFSQLLEYCLCSLGYQGKNEYTETELNNIEHFMLGIQLKTDYLTLCRECHDKVHSGKGGLSKPENEYKKYCDEQKAIEKQKYEQEQKAIVFDYLEDLFVNKVVFLTKKDRTELIETINLIDYHNSCKSKNIIKYVQNIETLNKYIRDTLELPYEIKCFETSRMIEGKKMKYKNAWKVVRLK